MAVYYLLYIVALKKNLSAVVRRGPRWWRRRWVSVYISYTFTMISDLAEKPALGGADFTRRRRGAPALNPHAAETIFRWGHSITGAVAVAGTDAVTAALHPKLKGRTGHAGAGGRVFVVAAVKATVLSLIYLALIDRGAGLGSPALHVPASPPSSSTPWRGCWRGGSGARRARWCR